MIDASLFAVVVGALMGCTFFLFWRNEILNAWGMARKSKSVDIPLAPGVTLTSRSNGYHSPVALFAGHPVADVLTLTSLLKRIDAADFDRIHYLIDQHMVRENGKMVFADATDETLFLCGRKAVVS